MSSPSVSALLERITAAGKAYEKNQEPGSREDLIDLSQALVAALEIPSEFIQRSFWSEVPRQIRPHPPRRRRPALPTPPRRRRLRPLPRGPSHQDRPRRPAPPARAAAPDFDQSRRLQGREMARDPLSDGLAEQKYQHSISFCYDVARPSFNGFPAFFKDTGYKQPTSLTNGPFQAAHETQLPFFDWLVATPPHLSHFDSFMSAYRAGKPDWWDFYPVEDRLVTGFDPTATNNDAFLVDVGGGRGHDLVQFAEVHGAHPGRLILQDREPVIAAAEKSDRFEAQVHDFFTPQPVKFARAYALHSILHDWGDEEGVKILENLRPALKKGYSRVLFNEIVLSEENPTLAATSMDMMMLAHFAVKERTERDWRAIVESAGLKVVKIYSFPGVAESVIEAELA
ncbi:O-methyltransferase [Apiospora arundinis]